MFYSTFEKLDSDLPSSGPMETRCVVKLYEPSPTPILYVGPVSNVLGRVPGCPGFSAETLRRPSHIVWRRLRRTWKGSNVY